MTVDEFMAGLRATQDRFEWKLVPDVSPESERRSKPRFHLCALGKETPIEGVWFDPIGALCYALKGAVYAPTDWRRAGNTLELAPVSAANLTAAATDLTWSGAEGQRAPSPPLHTLRASMIEAVGLLVDK